MLLVQVCLALLLGMLGPLASAASLRRVGGGWYAWSGVLLAAWVTGVSGILVMRFPDWAVLYLFEAMGHSRSLIAFFGALLSLLLALLGMRLVAPLLAQGRVSAARLRVLVAAVACAAALLLVRVRLGVITTTLEFAHGPVRPSSRAAGFQGLFALVLIGAAVPCLGTLLLLSLDSLRRREPGGPD